MIKSQLFPLKITWQSASLFSFAITLLAVTYLFQRVDFFNAAAVLLQVPRESLHPYTNFVVNKTLRLIVNDFACFIVIYVFFKERKYLKVAFALFLFELVILLPLYFIAKLSLEGDSEISSPLLSQFHRLIVNPTLMILLIISFFYARYVNQRSA